MAIFRRNQLVSAAGVGLVLLALAACGDTSTPSTGGSSDAAARLAYLHVVGAGLDAVGPAMTSAGTTCQNGTTDECTAALDAVRTKVETFTTNLDRQAVPPGYATGDSEMKKGLRDTTAALDEMHQAYVDVDTAKETKASDDLTAASTELSTAATDLGKE